MGRLLHESVTSTATTTASTAVAVPHFATMVAARFVSGLPHGAYFGVASLAAATLAPAGQRAKAVAAKR